MLPNLAVQVQGAGVVTADNCNTFTQSAFLASNLAGFVGLDGMMVVVTGYDTPNDGGQGTYYWSSTATGPGDGTTIIMPYGVSVGAWLRVALGTAAGANYAPPDPAGTSSLVGVMAGLAMVYSPVRTGSVLVTLTGNGKNNLDGYGYIVQLRTGAGAAPVNGASLAGTFLAGVSAVGAPAGTYLPFAVSYYLQGLPLGAPQWFDAGQIAEIGGAIVLTSVRMSLVEL